MEFLLIMTLGLASLALLLWTVRPIGPMGAGLIIALVLVAGAGFGTWWQAPPKAGSEQDPATSQRPLQVPNRGYVSSNTCQSCHPGEYASWHDSYHRTMTQVVTPETLLADWDGTSFVVRNKSYRLERRGDEYWVDMVDPEFDLERRFRGKLSASNNQTRRTQKRIIQSTGSHHQQVYWFAGNQGRQLHLLPATWLVEEKRWIPYDHTLLRPIARVELTEEWNSICIVCHATGAQPRSEPGNNSMDSHVGELGIACEACHGPANDHVERYNNPIARYARHYVENDTAKNSSKKDTGIVNPAKLSQLRSAQVCGQCHSVNRPRAEEAKTWLSSGSSYRPGDALQKTRSMFHRPDNSGEVGSPERFYSDAVSWPDGTIRVAGRDYHGLLDSPCFKSSDFTCLSCHSMHRYQDRADQLAEGMEGNQACLQCHPKFESRIEEHTHHAPNSPGSLCYNCHMPYTTYGLLKSIRSHTVSSPSVNESLESDRPNACNLCHLDRNLAWTDRALVSRYGADPSDLAEDATTQRSAAATWLLEGDAGQRALIAWAMGWEAGRQASGDDWMAPLLAELLDDPYMAVRFIARRSLGRLPGMGEIDLSSPGSARVHSEVMNIWRGGAGTRAQQTRDFDRVYLSRTGESNKAAVKAAKRNRDDRYINLAE